MNTASSTIIGVALLLRVLCSLSPYSGAQTPPKYGDYEAQRHWMELTTNLPAKLWYQDGPDNDPKYWPLDYPPLSGFQSFIHGTFVRFFDPAAVTLHTSRGYETYYSKLLLRWTVILSDLLVFFPAAYMASHVFSGPTAHQDKEQLSSAAQQQQQQRQLFVLAAMLLQPAAILVDHGHFQYNCISIGLAVLAAVAIAKRKDVLGSILFCLSLNHKQMGLFYAPAFFAHLLGRCLQEATYSKKVLAVAKLGAAVVATFVVCWSPWLYSLKSAGEVAKRIFPAHRGLYEDYLSNFWCTTSVAVKWKQLFNASCMIPACAGLTVLFALPSMVQQIAAPSARGLLMGMANSAFSFYMFGYHVHEKSILLPLLPITMLAAHEADSAIWGPVVASFSMFPLLVRDGVAMAYLAMNVLYVLVATSLLPPKGIKAVTVQNGKAAVLAATACVGAVCLHLLQLMVPPPEKYVWLYDRAFITYAFWFMAADMVYLNHKQWQRGFNGRGQRAAAKPQRPGSGGRIKHL